MYFVLSGKLSLSVIDSKNGIGKWERQADLTELL